VGEEQRRQVLLLMLNTHYSGAAQAEALNGEGKTDILIRFEDRNVLIAECKFWNGQAGFVATVEQLFGYSTWRDVKLAIVVFVDRRDLSAVVQTARDALERHAQFKGWLDHGDEESGMRAAMEWPGDPQRTVTLHVSMFLTPRR
jgi:hypothetical protein